MAKKCELTGKKPMTGHHVSHSQRHVKRRWLPNLRKVTIIDEKGRKRRIKISAKALKTLSKSPKIK